MPEFNPGDPNNNPFEDGNLPSWPGMPPMGPNGDGFQEEQGDFGNINPLFMQFMVLFSKWIEGLDSDDMDRIDRQNAANDWLVLVNRYINGSITIEELKSFESEELSEMPGWDGYVSDYVGDADTDWYSDTPGDDDSSGGAQCWIDLPFGGGSIEGKEDDQGNCIPLGVGDDDGDETTFEDYINEVGEGVANTAKGLYDELGDKITECVGSPLDCIKQIGSAILESGGIPEECTDMPNGGTLCGTAENPTPCWKDCVNFNLPGLPIPNIPLPPGVIDVGTYRDFENAVKTVGKTIGDLIDGDITVEEVFEDLKDWAREKWEGVFGGVDDATPEAVLDWLKGILGPATAGIIWSEIEEEVTDVLLPAASETKECPDPANPGQTIEVPADQECPEVPVECGAGEADFGNGCEPVCEYDSTISAEDPQCEKPLPAVEEQCNAQGKVYDDLNDECKEECKNEEYVIGADGSCGPYEGEDTDDDPQPQGCEEVDCNSPQPNAASSFDAQYAARLWAECCGATHCPSGTLKIDEYDDCSGEYNPDGVEECVDNGAVAPDCVQCPGYKTIPAWHEGGDCRNPYIDSGKPCGQNGEVYDDRGNCVLPEDPNEPQPEEEEECAKPDGTLTGATLSSGCEQCPDGYTFDFDGICQPDGGTIDCAQYNRETLDGGTCGGCLPGFQKDTTLPNEPCVQVFDGCPAGFELVNGECTATQCPEGQSYCESTGQCEEPQNCPGGPSEGGSGGRGGGGGFAGLNIQPLGIEGDPQLLGRQRFGQQDFLTPLFTGNQGGGLDFPIARFLQNKKGDIV